MRTIIICIFIVIFGVLYLYWIKKHFNKNKTYKKEIKMLTPEQRMQLYLKAVSERKPQKTPDEQLKELGYTFDMINEIEQEANRRNYYDGRYHSNYNAEFGSPDNPEVVGMPECSDFLHFSLERKHWILTDGLGNGWIR